MSVVIKIENFAEVDKQLSQLPITLRGKAVRDGLRAAGRAVQRVAKSIVPPPGYPGDKPGLKPLRDTIGVEVKEYKSATVAIVGPKRPDGWYGDLVEKGHMIAGTGRATTPNPFMEPAAEQTKGAQSAAIRGAIDKAIKQATGQ